MPVVIVLVIAGILLVIVVLYDVIKPAPATCGINARLLLPNTCEGACPVITSGLTQQCVSTATGTYLFGLVGQDTACGCVNPPGLGGGTGGGATGGGATGGAGEGTGGTPPPAEDPG